jgi:hypothetical protein
MFWALTPYTVILFAKDGLLSLLELVDNAGTGMLNGLPAPERRPTRHYPVSAARL